MRRALGLLIAAAALASFAAAARQADGTLGLIRTPNNGIPAMVAPGGRFDVVLRQRADLSLVGDQNGPALEIQWSDLAGGMVRARCTVPSDAAPGAYAVVATVDGATDRNDRAVYIRNGFPDYYVVAHLTDTHVGSGRHPRPAGDIFRDAIKAANESEAAFVVISGDLTDGGLIEQFRDFMAIMDECKLPTVVCPGNHDRDGLVYEQVFGPVTYGFLFGKDGYLVFDTKDFVMADDLDAQNANLEVLRQQIKPCRWSIGVTHRYEAAQSMRSQLILFVDNPLDHLMFGHQHRARENDPKQAPWNTTPMTMTPATVDGFMRLYDISDKEVRPREPQRVAETAPPEPAPEPTTAAPAAETAAGGEAQ